MAWRPYFSGVLLAALISLTTLPAMSDTPPPDTASVLASPLLILSGIEDKWSDPEGEFWGGLGASPVARCKLGRCQLAFCIWVNRCDARPYFK